METANSVIGLSKDCGPAVWRYVKYQICHNNYVSEFQKMQERLKDRRDVVDANLRTQVMQRGKIENKEVRAWLDEAQREIAEKVIEDPICKGGCFTYICSSRELDKKTRALCNEIFERGERYTKPGEILVMDDDSIQYRASVFEDMQKEVKHQKEKIEATLKTQLMQRGKTAWQKVVDWLEKANQQVTMKVEDLVSEGESSSSTNLEEKIEELKQILEEGRELTNVDVSLVIDDHLKKGDPMPVEKCIPRDEVKEEILQPLRGEKVTRIAVCRMGGVGKTTIMKQVHNQLLKEPTIKKVVWVKVSRDFDIVLQQKRQFDILKFKKNIAGKLGLNLKGDEDANELAERISQILQQGSCVLILDDVWEPFSLEDVGILDPDGNDACKLVLTTRLQAVGRQMKCELIHVTPLPDDEAIALFLVEVGSEVVSHPRYKSDIEQLSNQILKKCRGLPLAIKVVAKTMTGKVNPYLWEKACVELSKSEEIVDCLKFSYEHLEKERYKECFLYCALYPEDHEIPKKELIECWIEEGFIIDERGSRHFMICEGHDILEMLIDNCMLELVNKNKHSGGCWNVKYMLEIKYEEDCVSMHDLFEKWH
ncbi:hypothetical protein SLA2020_306750 [Shorea laevis]